MNGSGRDMQYLPDRGPCNFFHWAEPPVALVSTATVLKLQLCGSVTEWLVRLTYGQQVAVRNLASLLSSTTLVMLLTHGLCHQAV